MTPRANDPKILTLARSYLAAGLSVIPILADGSKRPAVRWKEYQSRLPTQAELEGWWGQGSPAWGIAIVCGRVSGGLEVIDFDLYQTYQAWAARISLRVPGLLEKLTRVKTPRPGCHVYYRSSTPVGGNRKLAADANGQTLIETRGEGGYVLAPGCPPECHPLRRGYELIGGPDFDSLCKLAGGF